MAKLTDLLAQKAALDKQIADAQREERSAIIVQIKSLMSEYGLTLADLGTRANAAPAKVAVKYRNPATGDSWSGRGLQPKWLKAELHSGRNLSDFLI
jgi:DNA-binding protein H-NS